MFRLCSWNLVEALSGTRSESHPSDKRLARAAYALQRACAEGDGGLQNELPQLPCVDSFFGPRDVPSSLGLLCSPQDLKPSRLGLTQTPRARKVLLDLAGEDENGDDCSKAKGLSASPDVNAPLRACTVTFSMPIYGDDKSSGKGEDLLSNPKPALSSHVTPKTSSLGPPQQVLLLSWHDDSVTACSDILETHRTIDLLQNRGNRPIASPTGRFLSRYWRFPPTHLRQKQCIHQLPNYPGICSQPRARAAATFLRAGPALETHATPNSCRIGLLHKSLQMRLWLPKRHKRE